MSVAKKERRRTLKRMQRGRQSRAESGKFLGGQPGLGYQIVGYGSNSDLEIDPEGANLVRLIFDTLEAEGGNLWGTAHRINAMGYTGDRGKPFRAKTLKWIATRKLYIGIAASQFFATRPANGYNFFKQGGTTMQQIYKIRLSLELDEPTGTFTVTSPDVPGLVTEGSTPAEIQANVQEAIVALLRGLAEFGLELPSALRPENAVSPPQMELLLVAA